MANDKPRDFQAGDSVRVVDYRRTHEERPPAIYVASFVAYGRDWRDGHTVVVTAEDGAQVLPMEKVLIFRAEVKG